METKLRKCEVRTSPYCLDWAIDPYGGYLLKSGKRSCRYCFDNKHFKPGIIVP